MLAVRRALHRHGGGAHVGVCVWVGGRAAMGAAWRRGGVQGAASCGAGAAPAAGSCYQGCRANQHRAARLQDPGSRASWGQPPTHHHHTPTCAPAQWPTPAPPAAPPPRCQSARAQTWRPPPPPPLRAPAPAAPPPQEASLPPPCGAGAGAWRAAAHRGRWRGVEGVGCSSRARQCDKEHRQQLARPVAKPPPTSQSKARAESSSRGRQAGGQAAPALPAYVQLLAPLHQLLVEVLHQAASCAGGGNPWCVCRCVCARADRCGGAGRARAGGPGARGGRRGAPVGMSRSFSPSTTRCTRSARPGPSSGLPCTTLGAARLRSSALRPSLLAM